MEHNLDRHKRAKREVRAFWSAVSFMGLALIALPATGILPPLLLFNPSESAPLGWYRIEAINEVSHGDLVVANLPKEAAEFAAQRGYLPLGIPVIKPVAALEGDTVCAANGVLRINGLQVATLLVADTAGRPLPSAWKTCRRLQADEFLLLSDRTPDSFDGRYFGTVRTANIIGRAVWMNSADQAGSGDMAEEMDGRSECKIKAHGANEGLVPCLHIDFYGSIPQGVAPSSDEYLNNHNRSGWFHPRELACFPPEQPE